MQLPPSHSVLECIREESKRKKLIPAVNRYVYLAEYIHMEKKNCAKFMQADMKHINNYCMDTELQVTGFLLIYTGHIVHFLECTEFSMKYHLLHVQEQLAAKLGFQFKLLSASHNICTRMFNAWMWADVNDQSLIGAAHNTYETNKNFARNITVLNLFRFSVYLRSAQPDCSGKINQKNILNQIARVMPESYKIMFLLSSDYFPTIKQILYVLEHCSLGKWQITWPIPHKQFLTIYEEDSEDD